MQDGIRCDMIQDGETQYVAKRRDTKRGASLCCIGASPLPFWAIAELAMQRLFAGTRRALGPRLFPLCFPGNHSLSASTFSKNSQTD